MTFTPRVECNCNLFEEVWTIDTTTNRLNDCSYTTTYRVNEWLDDVDIARYEDLYRTNPRRARIVCDGNGTNQCSRIVSESEVTTMCFFLCPFEYF
jgi:phage terminase large subunit